MNKSIYTIILSALVLQSCSKVDSLGLGGDNHSDVSTHNLSGKTLSFSAAVDATYEYDDDLRAILVTADDAPRIKLSEAELNGPDPDRGTNGPGERLLKQTSLRLNWFSYGTDNSLRSSESLNLNTHGSRKIKVETINGKDVVKVWVNIPPQNGTSTLDKQEGATWFAQMIVGGFPGRTDKAEQYFSRYRDGGEKGGKPQADVRSHPNSRIDELVPGTGEMGRRHLPLVGDMTPITRYWTNPNVQGSYEGNAPNSNTGQIGINEEMLLRARGTIFAFTLENKTGQAIQVTDIEVPVKEGSSRGAAFSFEGFFQASRIQPFSGGVINRDACIPRFEKYKSQFVPANEETNLFPLYRRGGSRNVPLTVDQVSTGRFMVWAYVHEPNKPFAVRVRYTIGRNRYYSKFQTVSPPETGFKEGKAYRAKLLIKDGTQI